MARVWLLSISNEILLATYSSSVRSFTASW